MGQRREDGIRPPLNEEAGVHASPSDDSRHLDFLAFGVVLLVISLAWIPTLASGQRLNRDEDFFLYACRHAAIRKSVVEHHTFPLRSHWFGGGFPTLGEPEDPALNPLVLLSVLFGSVTGIKLIGFLAALTSGVATYALARYILEYTRWGALFSALMVGVSLYVPERMEGGNPNELCPAYLPLCMLLLALACRGRRAALFLLPLLLYTMLSDGKQTFFVAMFYLGVLCVLDAVPVFMRLAPPAPGRKLNARALKVLVLVLGVAFLVGMVRILAVLELLEARGGLMGVEPFGHAGLKSAIGLSWHTLWHLVSGAHGVSGDMTVGWLPLILLGIGCCCFWKRALPWAIVLLLCVWLVLGDTVSLNLFRTLEGLPVFRSIGRPSKYFGFEIVFSAAVGAGQVFWLLRRFRPKWLEHVCAIVLIGAGVSFFYPKSVSVQRDTYTMEVSWEALAHQEEFFNVAGLGLPRNRSGPPRALCYLNVLQNIGTTDWYAAVTLPEYAVPRYFVDAANRVSGNPEYRGEAYFLQDAGEQAPVGSVGGWVFGPNAIAVAVTVPKASTLVINQNYHPAWKTDCGELRELNGLLAVRLSKAGSYTVRLRYLPPRFVVGLVVSVLSILLWTLACWKLGRGGRTPSAGG